MGTPRRRNVTKAMVSDFVGQAIGDASLMSAAPAASGGAAAILEANGLTKRQSQQLVQMAENQMNSRFSDMWAAFKYVDVDSSGRVNRDEIARALHLWGIHNPHGDLGQAADAIMRACDSDGDGTIDYKEFVQGLARDKFVGAEAPPTRKARSGGDPLADPLSKLHAGVTAEELVNAHGTVRDKLLLRHDTIYKAFKYMDKDGSGFINRKEFEDALRDLNVSIRKPVLDSLIDIIDVEDNDDGDDDNDIGFREFARVMTAADFFKMKALAPRPTSHVMDERERLRVEALEHMRPGVTADSLRKFHEQVKSKILARKGKHTWTETFKLIDADRTGTITREELKNFLKTYNLAMVKENILDTLCDFIDCDNSGSFGYTEFARVLSADDVMQWAPKNAPQ